MKGKQLPSAVKGIMTKPIITTETDSSVHEAAELISSKNVGSIVVVQKRKPVGIVTERDIVERVVAKGFDASKVLMEEIMSKPLIAVKSNLSLINAIRFMQKKKIRRLLVIEKKRLIGIVTQRDLLRALAFHLIVSFRPLLETE